MCTLAASKYFINGATKVARRCVRAFFMPYMHHNIGAQPRELVVMANSSFIDDALTTGSGHRLFLPKS